MLDLTVAEIKKMLCESDEDSFKVLERSLQADTRKGVKNAIEVARRRIESERNERMRLEQMYSFEHELAKSHNAQLVLGCDEVGRGPLAGPLAVGAVVLNHDFFIEGLRDSKQLKPSQREKIADEIKNLALSWSIQFIEPEVIDNIGMSESLKRAFRNASEEIEESGIVPDIILLDGNALHFDKREVNIVKGDAQCASIAAASIITKVERDSLMSKLDKEYPLYGFASNKGYASPEHIEAIRTYGLTPIHRKSFCTAFSQQTLFDF